jgi:hypothetical protein
MMHRRRTRGEVLYMPVLGGAYEIAYEDLPPICAQAKGKPRLATNSNGHNLLT